MLNAAYPHRFLLHDSSSVFSVRSPSVPTYSALHYFIYALKYIKLESHFIFPYKSFPMPLSLYNHKHSPHLSFMYQTDNTIKSTIIINTRHIYKACHDCPAVQVESNKEESKDPKMWRRAEFF